MNKGQRNRQKYSTGAHPSTIVSPDTAQDLGVYLVHGGDHPGTKHKPSKEEAKRKKKQQRQARKR